MVYFAYMLAELFEKHNLTGYELKPVNVCNRSLPFNLWELFVTAKADYHPDCGIKEIYRCNYCNCTSHRSYNDDTGIIIDDSTWDGGDFFTIEPYPKYIFITERVKELILSQKLTAVSLMPSTELRYPEHLTTKYHEERTKEQWAEYFERDITELKEKFEKEARDAWERVALTTEITSEYN